jgi:hypothetical protein
LSAPVLGSYRRPRVLCTTFVREQQNARFKSVAEFDLSVKYRLKAAGCEQQAKLTSNQIAEQEWRQLAAQWLSMADKAVKMNGDTLHALVDGYD